MFRNRLASLFMAALIVAAVAGCTRPVEGNYLVVRNWDKAYNNDTNTGWEWTVFDDAFEIYGRERLLQLSDARPKDKENVMLQDLDITVAYRTLPQGSVGFLRKYGDMTPHEGVYLVGETYIEKDAKSVIGDTVRKFTSMQILDEKSKVERAFKDDLQVELDRLYGKGVFEITDVKIANIVVSPATEERIQSVALINAEQARADAESKVLATRQKLQTQQMQVLASVARDSGLSVDQVLEARRLEVIERLPAGAVQVVVPADAKK